MQKSLRGGCYELLTAFDERRPQPDCFAAVSNRRCYWSICPRDILRLEDSRATGRAPPSRTGRLALIGGKGQQIRASFCSCSSDRAAS